MNSLITILFVLTLAITHTFAHSGGDMGDMDPESTSMSAGSDEQYELKDKMAGNVGLGFLLTAIAAIASALGSLTPYLDLLFPYIPFLSGVKITESKGFLAGSFSFAAGITLFLTLGDLFPEAIAAFKESGVFDPKYSSSVASAIFIFTISSIMIGKAIIRKYRGEKLTEDDATLREVDEKNANFGDKSIITSDNSRKLKSMGASVAIAMAIHNFPEGIATFATTIESPQIGIQFAIALALHKIPEGLIISLPIYYATKSRFKAFLLAASVGITFQMLGAVLGYVLFVTYWNEAVSGVLFSIVAGFLLYVVLHGMIPFARSNDPKDRYCTYYLFAGIFFLVIVAAIFDLE